MYQLDDVQLYDLSEAGRLLFRDPVRLAREARARKIPSALIPEGLGLPVPWVDALAGTRPEDPEAARYVWLRRLAPPSPDAHRASRPREALPMQATIPAASAAERLLATPAALERMDGTGELPSLRVDGSRHYDPVLVELLASVAAGDDVDLTKLERRRAECRALARFEYRSHPSATRAEEQVGRVTPPSDPILVTVPPAVSPKEGSDTTAHAPDSQDAAALDEAKAHTPSAEAVSAEDQAPSTPEPKPARLIRAEGFETVDDDEA